MSDPDQPVTDAPEGADSTAAKAQPQKRSRPGGSGIGAPVTSPRPTTRSRSAATREPKPPVTQPPANPAGSISAATERLSGVAGVDRPDPLQHGRRIWPD